MAGFRKRTGRHSGGRCARETSMDSLIATARVHSRRRSLGVLKRVALRDDAPALALRGIAMATARRFWFERRSCCEVRARLRSERGRGPRQVRSSPRPRLHSSRATWLACQGARGGARDARRATATLSTPRMRGISRSGASPDRRIDEAERTLAELHPAPSLPH